MSDQLITDPAELIHIAVKATTAVVREEFVRLNADLVKAEQAIVLLKNLVDAYEAEVCSHEPAGFPEAYDAARAYLATIDDI